MADSEPAHHPSLFPNYLFGFKGRIGRARYFASMAIAVALLLAAAGCLATAMAPTGGGGPAPLLAIPLFGLFVWVLAAAMVQRLRDAGRPPMLAIALILGPILLLFPGLELIEYAAAPMALIFVVFLMAPGFLKAKPAREVAAPT